MKVAMGSSYFRGTAQLIFEGKTAELSVPLSEMVCSEIARDEYWLRVKRAIDLLGALALLVLLAPVFLIVAALIYVLSPGPLFFRQERLGLHGRPFVMFKFRTMVAGAEQNEGELRQGDDKIFFKPRSDPRLTPLGSCLRRYSLDELPQLFNVLVGEMSLVGPRPIREFELERFDSPTAFRRFSMKPGLTCIWQVSGRSSTTDKQRMRYDVEYVDRWSPLLDVKLLLKTIPAVIRGDGAV